MLLLKSHSVQVARKPAKKLAEVNFIESAGLDWSGQQTDRWTDRMICSALLPCVKHRILIFSSGVIIIPWSYHLANTQGNWRQHRKKNLRIPLPVLAAMQLKMGVLILWGWFSKIRDWLLIKPNKPAGLLAGDKLCSIKTLTQDNRLTIVNICRI